jgi:hypothetical protein
MYIDKFKFKFKFHKIKIHILYLNYNLQFFFFFFDEYNLQLITSNFYIEYFKKVPHAHCVYMKRLVLY